MKLDYNSNFWTIQTDLQLGTLYKFVLWRSYRNETNFNEYATLYLVDSPYTTVRKNSTHFKRGDDYEE
jgi:hypothetical protein